MLPHLCMKYSTSIRNSVNLPLAGKMIPLASVLYLVAGNKPLQKLSIFDVSFHLYCPAFEVVTRLSSYRLTNIMFNQLIAFLCLPSALMKALA